MVMAVRSPFRYGSPGSGLPLTAFDAQLAFSDDTIAGKLPRLRRGFTNVRLGISDCRLVYTGDSKTNGWGAAASNTWSVAYPYRAAQLLNSAGCPHIHGGVMPRSTNSGATTETRVVLGTGWTEAGLWGLGKASYWGNAPSGNLSVTPGTVADTYDVYVLRGTAGTVTVQASGGSAVGPTSTAGVNAIIKVTCVAGSASTGNTVTISATGQVVVVYVEARNSGLRQVLHHNTGVPNSSTSTHATGTPAHQDAGFIAAMAPDAVFVQLGTVDAAVPTSYATTYANIETLILAFQATSDVVLIAPTDINVAANAAGNAQQIANRKMYQELGRKYGCPVVDFYERFGPWHSRWFVDQVHENAAGQMDQGACIARFIASVVGGF